MPAASELSGEVGEGGWVGERTCIGERETELHGLSSAGRGAGRTLAEAPPESSDRTHGALPMDFPRCFRFVWRRSEAAPGDETSGARSAALAVDEGRLRARRCQQQLRSGDLGSRLHVVLPGRDRGASARPRRHSPAHRSNRRCGDRSAHGANLRQHAVAEWAAATLLSHRGGTARDSSSRCCGRIRAASASSDVSSTTRSSTRRSCARPRWCPCLTSRCSRRWRSTTTNARRSTRIAASVPCSESSSRSAYDRWRLFSVAVRRDFGRPASCSAWPWRCHGLLSMPRPSSGPTSTGVRRRSRSSRRPARAGASEHFAAWWASISPAASPSISPA